MSKPQTIYKLTSPDCRTRIAHQNEITWEPHVEHTAPGGSLCTAGVIHAYASSNHAQIFDCVHGAYGRCSLLWQGEGVVHIDDGTKLGLTSCTLHHPVSPPLFSFVDYATLAIRCTQVVVYGNEDPEWVAWSEAWLSGEDRSSESADHIASSRPRWGNLQSPSTDSHPQRAAKEASRVAWLCSHNAQLKDPIPATAVAMTLAPQGAADSIWWAIAAARKGGVKHAGAAGRAEYEQIQKIIKEYKPVGEEEIQR